MHPGAYRLTKTIKNPHPDRRSKSWSCWPEIKADTIFVFNVWGRITMVGERDYGGIRQDTDLGKLIVEFVEPTEETVITVMRKYDAHTWHSLHLPETLIEHRIITLQQLEDVLAKDYEKDNPSKDEEE